MARLYTDGSLLLLSTPGSRSNEFIAIPHCAREDFIYERGNGFKPLLIPKGALVIPNIWFVSEKTLSPEELSFATRKMLHDPDRYADPMVFDPSRFIPTSTKSAEPDPTGMCFGFGRR